MDFTLSDQYAVDASTGFRLHQDTAAVPTVLSAKDVNSIIWSLMAIVRAAGKLPKQFDQADPATYGVLLDALNSLYVSPSQLASALTPVGTVMLALGTSALPGTLKLNGALYLRSEKPALYAYALASGNIVDDASWSGRRGAFSYGDGATTFRVPNVRGVFPRFFHDGDSTDPDYLTRLMGILQMSQNLAHSHNLPNIGARGDAFAVSSPWHQPLVFDGGAVTSTTSNGGSEARSVNLPFLGLIKY